MKGKAKDYRREIMIIVTDMISDVDEIGIFPTTRCFDDLETLMQDFANEQNKELKEKNLDELINHLHDEHDLILVESEIREIKIILEKP